MMETRICLNDITQLRGTQGIYDGTTFFAKMAFWDGILMLGPTTAHGVHTGFDRHREIHVNHPT